MLQQLDDVVGLNDGAVKVKQTRDMNEVGTRITVALDCHDITRRTHHAHVQGVRLFCTAPNRGAVGRASTFDLVRGDESRLQLLAKDNIVSEIGSRPTVWPNTLVTPRSPNAGGVQGHDVRAGRDGRLGEGSRKALIQDIAESLPHTHS